MGAALPRIRRKMPATAGREHARFGIGSPRLYRYVRDADGNAVGKQPLLFDSEYEQQRANIPISPEQFALHNLLAMQRPDGSYYATDEEWQAALDKAEQRLGIEGLGGLIYLNKKLEPDERNLPPLKQVHKVTGAITTMPAARKISAAEAEKRKDKIFAQIIGNMGIIQSKRAMSDEPFEPKNSEEWAHAGQNEIVPPDQISHVPTVSGAVGEAATTSSGLTPEVLQALAGIVKDAVAEAVPQQLAVLGVEVPAKKKPDGRSGGAYPCPVEGCGRVLKSKAGLSGHMQRSHKDKKGK